MLQAATDTAITPCVVRECRGARGCPRALLDVAEASAAIAEMLDACGASDTIRRRVKGPLLEHHRFKVSVSGCPNACAQPQIADFGLIGEERPRVDQSACIECGACVEVCGEGALELTGTGLLIDARRCVGCGSCIAVCPVEALSSERKGWRVLMGGRLGRHPRLAAEVMQGASLDEASRMARAVVGLWVREGAASERVGATLDRLAGMEGESLALTQTEGERASALALLLKREGPSS